MNARQPMIISFFLCLLFRKLLTRALEFLDESRHPKICLDAHERLSELLFGYIPSRVFEPPTKGEKQKNVPKESNYQERSLVKKEPLVVDKHDKTKQASINWNLTRTQRINCEASLNHLNQCVRLVVASEERNDLNKSQIEQNMIRLKSKIFLRQLSLAYAAFHSERYGLSLRFICEIVWKMDQEPKVPNEKQWLPLILSLTGDVFQALQELDHANTEINSAALEDFKMETKLEVIGNNRFPPFPLDINNELETNCVKAIPYYLRAGNYAPINVVYDSEASQNENRTIEHVWSQSEHLKVGRKLKEVYLKLGDYYVATGRYTKASQHFQNGISLFKSMADNLSTCIMQYNLASLLLKQINFSFSPAMFGKAQTQEPPNWADYQGKIKKAQEFLEAAKLNDQLKETEKGMWEDALRLLGNIHMHTSTYYERENKKDEALDQLKKALACYNEAGEVNAELGHCYYKLGYFYYQSAMAENSKSKKLSIAISYFDRSVQYFTSEKFPFDYMQIHLELLKLFKQLTIGSRIENLEKALKFLFRLGAFFDKDKIDVPASVTMSGKSNSINEKSSENSDLNNNDSNPPDSSSNPKSNILSFTDSKISGKKEKLFTSAAETLWPLIQQETHGILKELLKLYTNLASSKSNSNTGSNSSGNNTHENLEGKIQKAKEIYRLSLVQTPHAFFDSVNNLTL